MPATNRTYWVPKIDENKQRDRRNTSALEAAGWRVLRVWEHEDPERIADEVARLVDAQRSGNERS